MNYQQKRQFRSSVTRAKAVVIAVGASATTIDRGMRLATSPAFSRRGMANLSSIMNI